MKSRLYNAMEAHGATEKELMEVLKGCYDPKYYDNTMLKGIMTDLLNNDREFDHIDGDVTKALALLCNVSSDYLLGLTNNMTPIG